MPRLTKKRKKKAKPILKKHNRLLQTDVPGDLDPRRWKRTWSGAGTWIISN